MAVSHFRTQVKGKDGMPQGIVSKALPIIAPFLTRLFNSSLANGVFPPAQKKVPVPSSTSDFRPIALLCFLAKVLEKLAYDQVVDFLAKQKIMDPF